MSWSLYFIACIDCGETRRKHISHGLCSRCYKKRLREGTRPKRGSRPWSSVAAACVACGSATRKHRGHGLCRACHLKKYRATEDGKRVTQAGQRRYAMSERGRTARSKANLRWQTQPINREKVRLVLDHHHPLRDGHTLLHNAVPLCVSCNVRKNRKTPREYYDGWKLTEIAMRLLETREAFEERFAKRDAAC